MAVTTPMRGVAVLFRRVREAWRIVEFHWTLITEQGLPHARTSTMSTRREHDLPPALADWGWRYHHLGIPTTRELPDGVYLSGLKCAVSGFGSSPFGVEWMRFDDDSPIHPLVRSVPHLAFVVDDLDHELATRGFTVLSEPTSPMAGLRVAMIEHDGAPIELMEFRPGDARV